MLLLKTFAVAVKVFSFESLSFTSIQNTTTNQNKKKKLQKNSICKKSDPEKLNK